jgi:hypothetical protein
MQNSKNRMLLQVKSGCNWLQYVGFYAILKGVSRGGVNAH